MDLKNYTGKDIRINDTIYRSDGIIYLEYEHKYFINENGIRIKKIISEIPNGLDLDEAELYHSFDDIIVSNKVAKYITKQNCLDITGATCNPLHSGKVFFINDELQALSSNCINLSYLEQYEFNDF